MKHVVVIVVVALLVVSFWRCPTVSRPPPVSRGSLVTRPRHPSHDDICPCPGFILNSYVLDAIRHDTHIELFYESKVHHKTQGGPRAEKDTRVLSSLWSSLGPLPDAIVVHGRVCPCTLVNTQGWSVHAGGAYKMICPVQTTASFFHLHVRATNVTSHCGIQIQDKSHAAGLMKHVVRDRTGTGGILSMSYSIHPYMREVVELYKQQGFAYLYIFVSTTVNTQDTNPFIYQNLSDILQAYIADNFVHIISVNLPHLTSSLDGLRISTNNIAMSHAFSCGDMYVFRGDSDNAIMFPRALSSVTNTIHMALLKTQTTEGCGLRLKARDATAPNCDAKTSIYMGERWPYDQVTINYEVMVYTAACQYMTLHRCEICQGGRIAANQHMYAPKDMLSLQHWVSLNKPRWHGEKQNWTRISGMYATDWFPDIKQAIASSMSHRTPQPLSGCTDNLRT